MTGKDRYLSESVKGTDRAARREAEKTMARLQAEVDGQRSAQSRVTLSSTLDEWLKTLEVEDSTRDGYIGYVERNIRPTLGAVPIAKLSTRTLETFYAELRRCRIRCNGRPTVAHRVAGEHSCDATHCAPHVCKPMAASTVRQVHAVISGALSAAVRWGWLTSNPARGAQRPRQTPPHPEHPCSPHSVSSRYRNLARRLEIDTHIHALRHYSGTELLTAGIDLRTVAGRLGHGGGGATTLRVYAAWVAATDRKAAEILGSRMPKRPTRRP